MSAFGTPVRRAKPFQNQPRPPTDTWTYSGPQTAPTPVDESTYANTPAGQAQLSSDRRQYRVDNDKYTQALHDDYNKWNSTRTAPEPNPPSPTGPLSQPLRDPNTGEVVSKWYGTGTTKDPYIYTDNEEIVPEDENDREATFAALREYTGGNVSKGGSWAGSGDTHLALRAAWHDTYGSEGNKPTEADPHLNVDAGTGDRNGARPGLMNYPRTAHIYVNTTSGSHGQPVPAGMKTTNDFQYQKPQANPSVYNHPYKENDDPLDFPGKTLPVARFSNTSTNVNTPIPANSQRFQNQFYNARPSQYPGQHQTVNDRGIVQSSTPTIQHIQTATTGHAEAAGEEAHDTEPAEATGSQNLNEAAHNTSTIPKDIHSSASGSTSRPVAGNILDSGMHSKASAPESDEHKSISVPSQNITRTSSSAIVPGLQHATPNVVHNIPSAAPPKPETSSNGPPKQEKSLIPAHDSILPNPSSQPAAQPQDSTQSKSESITTPNHSSQPTAQPEESTQSKPKSTTTSNPALKPAATQAPASKPTTSTSAPKTSASSSSEPPTKSGKEAIAPSDNSESNSDEFDNEDDQSADFSHHQPFEHDGFDPNDDCDHSFKNEEYHARNYCDEDYEYAEHNNDNFSLDFDDHDHRMGGHIQYEGAENHQADHHHHHHHHQYHHKDNDERTEYPNNDFGHEEYRHAEDSDYYAEYQHRNDEDTSQSADQDHYDDNSYNDDQSSPDDEHEQHDDDNGYQHEHHYSEERSGHVHVSHEDVENEEYQVDNGQHNYTEEDQSWSDHQHHYEPHYDIQAY